MKQFMLAALYSFAAYPGLASAFASAEATDAPQRAAAEQPDQVFVFGKGQEPGSERWQTLEA